MYRSGLDIQRWINPSVDTFARIMAGVVVAEGLLAFVLTYGLGVGPIVDTTTGLLTVLVTLAVALGTFVTTHFGLFPSQLRGAQTDQQRATDLRRSTQLAGYGFAQGPSTYGLVAAIMTGQGLIVLPFVLISAGWFLAIGRYFEDVWPEQPRA